MKQYLTEATKVKWVKRSQILLEEVKNATQLGGVVFSDEKDLKAFNRKNDRSHHFKNFQRHPEESEDNESTSKTFECDGLGNRIENLEELFNFCS